MLCDLKYVERLTSYEGVAGKAIIRSSCSCSGSNRCVGGRNGGPARITAASSAMTEETSSEVVVAVLVVVVVGGRNGGPAWITEASSAMILKPHRLRHWPFFGSSVLGTRLVV